MQIHSTRLCYSSLPIALLASIFLYYLYYPTSLYGQDWISSSLLQEDHFLTTSILLQNGNVLIIGGSSSLTPFSSTCEVFNPLTNTSTNTALLPVQRTWVTGILLQDGRVLVIGGFNGQPLPNCHLYDPNSDSWKATSSLNIPRSRTTATLLQDGKVLVTGGYSYDNGITITNSCEIFDPILETWTIVPPMSHVRSSHAAVTLSDGKILVASGYPYYTSCELFDPSTHIWSETGSLVSGFPTGEHSLTKLADGTVLLAGGWGGTKGMTGRCEIYDPISGNWSLTGSLKTPRAAHRTVLLPNNKVLVIGGHNAYQAGVDGSCYSIASCELYDPLSHQWSDAPSLPTPVSYFAACLLPSGEVFIGGGGKRNVNQMPEIYYKSTFIFDYRTPRSINSISHINSTSSVQTALSDGGVLFTGGLSSCGSQVSTNTCSIYHLGSNTILSSNPLLDSLSEHTCTLLPSGDILTVGGQNNLQISRHSELYNQSKNNWTFTGDLSEERCQHTATLLFDGRVFVFGGIRQYSPSLELARDCEIFDQKTNSWHSGTSISIPRFAHTATLLPNGSILIAGGLDSNSHFLSSCEIYNPTCNEFKDCSELHFPHAFHTATLLADGTVLITGGIDNSGATSETEIYDYRTDKWVILPPLSIPRFKHTSTLLPSGDILICGGVSTQGNTINTVEVFSHYNRMWKSSSATSIQRNSHSANLLVDGRVLIGSGEVDLASVCNTSTNDIIYDQGLDFVPSDRPIIDNIKPDLKNLTGSGSIQVTIEGSGFRDNNNRQSSEASTGDYNNSPTNYPIVQIRRIGGDKFDNDFLAYLPFDATHSQWSSTNTQVLFPLGTPGNRKFPAGCYALTVIANGIPSLSSIISITYNDSISNPAISISTIDSTCNSRKYRIRSFCDIGQVDFDTANVSIEIEDSLPSNEVIINVKSIDSSKTGKFSFKINKQLFRSDSILSRLTPVIHTIAHSCETYSIRISLPCTPLISFLIDSLHSNNTNIAISSPLPADSITVHITLINPSIEGVFSVRLNGISVSDTLLPIQRSSFEKLDNHCDTSIYLLTDTCFIRSITFDSSRTSNVQLITDTLMPSRSIRLLAILIEKQKPGFLSGIINNNILFSDSLSPLPLASISTEEITCATHEFSISNPCRIDSLIIDSLLCTNVNIVIVPSLPSLYSRVRIQLIDKQKDGTYSLFTHDHQRINGSIHGVNEFRINDSSVSNTSPCRSIVIENTSDRFPLEITTGYFNRNLEYSIPPSQIPLSIPPGEKRDIQICYTPLQSGIHRDTLTIADDCSEIQIPFVMEGLESLYQSFTSCGTTIQLRSVGSEKAAVLIAQNSSVLSVSIDKPSSDRTGSDNPSGLLINFLGNVVSRSQCVYVGSKIISNKHIENYRLELDIHSIPDGVYILAIQGVATSSYPIRIVH